MCIMAVASVIGGVQWKADFQAARCRAKFARMLTLTIANWDADADAVTRLLGVTPTAVARRGEPRPSGRSHDFNVWVGSGAVCGATH